MKFFLVLAAAFFITCVVIDISVIWSMNPPLAWDLRDLLSGGQAEGWR